jgi:hypothetical protein
MTVKRMSVFTILLAFLTLTNLAPAQAASKRKLSHTAHNNVAGPTPAHKTQSSAPNMTDNWTGGGDGSSWNNASNWSGGVPDSSSTDVVIGTTTANVNDNIAATIGNLTLSKSGDSLSIGTLQSLTVDGSSIDNNGTLTINGSDCCNVTALTIGGSSVTLSGSGTLVMSNNSHNQINGTAGNQFINQSTIQGVGNIGVGNLTLSNSGTINANTSGAVLYIEPGAGGMTNTGTVEATSGGVLSLYGGGGGFTNTTGTILANGGTVDLQNGVSITGGTLTTENGGLIQVGPSGSGNASLSGVTISSGSTVQVSTLTALTLSGTITNNGTLLVNGSDCQQFATIAKVDCYCLHHSHSLGAHDLTSTQH